jgi:hypothetical protein
MAVPLKSALAALTLVILALTSLSLAQTSPQTLAPHAEYGHEPDPSSGNISGTVVDQSGAVVAGARVTLTGPTAIPAPPPSPPPSKLSATQKQDVLSGDDGQFSFSNITAGPFHLTVTSNGFAPQISTGILHSGETYIVPKIALSVANNTSEVDVTMTQVEVAEAEIKVEEKQRVLGAIPNFYVSYIPDAAPLTSTQKFKLAWKTVIDPFTFVFVGGAAGVEQAQNHFSGYGQGTEGYAKRFGAGYADTVAGTFIGGAIFPSLLKQDPRYFYKGTGSIPSRFLYAIANSFICKGDNGRWQPNYSNVLGSLAAGGISNIYYPSQDRSGAALTFENAGIGLGATAVSNLLQEFLIRKLTPKIPGRNPTNIPTNHPNGSPNHAPANVPGQP